MWKIQPGKEILDGRVQTYSPQTVFDWYGTNNNFDILTKMCFFFIINEG